MDSRSVEQVIKEIQIKQITNPRLVQTTPETTIARAIEIMQEHRAGYVVIATDERVAGIFTETDVARLRDRTSNGPCSRENVKPGG